MVIFDASLAAALDIEQLYFRQLLDLYNNEWYMFKFGTPLEPNK